MSAIADTSSDRELKKYPVGERINGPATPVAECDHLLMDDPQQRIAELERGGLCPIGAGRTSPADRPFDVPLRFNKHQLAPTE
jgi:hypothetical protein